jgi:hypothetical protein
MLVALKRLVCKLLGVDYVVRHIGASEDRLQRGLLLVGNALRYAREDPATVRETPEYRRVAEVVGLLQPCRVEGLGFVRIGAGNDGGYVMLDALAAPHVAAAYSCGVGDDVSWDLDVASHGIDVWLFDHTVPRLPAEHPRFRFARTGLTGRVAAPRCRTLGQLIAANGHEGRRDLILKMDIEGAEWDVLDETATATLEQFQQIVVEFHDVAKVLDPVLRKPLVAVLEKLNRTHQVVHVHGNGCDVPVWIGDLVLPQVTEVTYVRRRDFEGRFVPHTGTFPTELDRPNRPGFPDVFLGRFGADCGETRL